MCCFKISFNYNFSVYRNYLLQNNTSVELTSMFTCLTDYSYWMIIVTYYWHSCIEPCFRLHTIGYLLFHIELNHDTSFNHTTFLLFVIVISCFKAFCYLFSLYVSRSLSLSFLLYFAFSLLLLCLCKRYVRYVPLSEDIVKCMFVKFKQNHYY